MPCTYRIAAPRVAGTLCVLVVTLIGGADTLFAQGVSETNQQPSSGSQWFSGAVPVLGQGLGLRGVSPVNESMAGAAVACPIDAAGALYWNPASLSGLPGCEASVSMDVVLPGSQLSSRIDPSQSLPAGAAGSSYSQPCAVALPSVAFVHKEPHVPVAFGIGVFGIGGSKVDYSVNGANPILQAGATGPLTASYNILEIVGAVSYALTDRIAIGVAPTLVRNELTAASLWISPSNAGSYVRELSTREFWGGGVQAGLYCTTDSGWHFGASLKSPQWMEPIRYRANTAQNQVVDAVFRCDEPLIAALGVCYSGFPNWLWACDVRYFNYASTVGFGAPTIAANGTLNGLGWRDVVSVALGVQRELSDRCSIRLGYCYNDNPIPSGLASAFSVATPLVTQHSVHAGTSYTFGDHWTLSVAYVHCFENSLVGPIVNPYAGALPGTQVLSRSWGDVVSAGVTKRF